MAKPPIDDRAADRLLSGAMAPEDAPAGFDQIARLVQAVQAPPSSAELAGERTVASMAAAAVSSPVQASANPRPHRRTSMPSKLAALRAAAITAAAVLGAGTAAAAATGSLRGQAASQTPSTVSAALADNPSNNNPSNKNKHGSAPKSPIVIAGVSFPATGPGNGHAVPGLCTALESQFAQDPNSPSFTHAKPFKNLISKTGGTPTAANTWCKAHTSTASDPDNTERPDPDANKPSSSTNSHAHSFTTPAPTPHTGSTGPANTASGGKGSTATSTANTKTAGHSSTGSANANGHPVNDSTAGH